MNIPEGWKLVPIKITERMIEAAWDAMPLEIEGREDDGEATDDGYQKLYEAMLAHAPEPPNDVPRVEERHCICAAGFGMNLSCPLHGVDAVESAEHRQK